MPQFQHVLFVSIKPVFPGQSHMKIHVIVTTVKNLQLLKWHYVINILT